MDLPWAVDGYSDDRGMFCYWGPWRFTSFTGIVQEPTVLFHLIWILYLKNYIKCNSDRLCGLEVRFPGQRSRGPGFDSSYHIFWVVVGLERGPLSLLSTIEELLGRNSSDSGLENREYGHGDPLRWPRDTLYPQKLALTSPTCGGCSVSIVRLRTKTTEFVTLPLSYGENRTPVS
jgi:hypothetical protein